MAKQDYGLAARRAEKSGRAWWYLVFMFFLALGASSWITQSIAEGYSYHQALGSPLFGHFYAPWQWLVWQGQHQDSLNIMGKAIDQGLMIFVFPQAILFLYIFGRKPKGNKNLHGSAKWAELEDIQRAGLLDGQGAYVGGWMREHTGFGAVKRLARLQRYNEHLYLRHNGPEHIMAFAPTRSGKGVGLVLPTLLSWPYSTLVLDIKGENWALTAGWRKSQGHKVLRFDPKNVDSSARFNPFESIRLEEIEAVQDAQSLAMIILDPKGEGLKDYFDKAAFAFFTAAVLHCLIIKKKEGKMATMTDFALMLTDPNLNTQELLDSMIEEDHAAILGKHVRFADEIHMNIASSAQEMKNKADKELSGVLSTAGVNLSLYKDPTIAYVTSGSDFRVEDLMNHETPVSLYFIISPADIDRLRPLTRLLINIFLCRLTEKMEFEDGRAVSSFKHRLLLMLDEFTSLGNLAIIERALAFMAGYGIKAYIIIQDLTQLQKAYTKEEAIMSNCHIRIAYAPNKIETAKLLSEMTGKMTVVDPKTSLSGSSTGQMKNASISVSEVGRALLTPDECMQLPGMIKDADGNVKDSGDMLIFVAGFPTIRGKQILSFQDPVFAKRSHMPAPPVTDRLYSDVAASAIPQTIDKSAQQYEKNLAAVSADGI